MGNRQAHAKLRNFIITTLALRVLDSSLGSVLTLYMRAWAKGLTYLDFPFPSVSDEVDL